MSRVVVLKMLPDGRACIHWFRRHADGLVKTPSHVQMTERGPLQLGGATGSVACRPEQNTILTQYVGGEYLQCLVSDDPRAATCPGCLATEEHKVAMGEQKEKAA